MISNEAANTMRVSAAMTTWMYVLLIVYSSAEVIGKKHIDEQIYIIFYTDYKYKISQTHLVKKRKLQPPTTSHVFPSIY